MPKSREEKARILEDLRQTLGEARSYVLAEFRGLTVEQETELRKKMRAAGLALRVAKNTLVALADPEHAEGLRDYLAGPTLVVVSKDDPVAPARELTDFIRPMRQPPITIKGGVVEGKVVGPKEVQAIASLPSRPVLLGQVLGGLKSPMASMASLLAAPLRNLVADIDALRRKREEAGSGAAA